MLKKRSKIVLSVLVVLGMLAIASPAFASLSTKSVKGTVIAKNRRTHVVTVESSLGKKVKLKYRGTRTELFNDGSRIALRRLQVGNQVTADFAPLTGGALSGVAQDVDDDFGEYDIEGLIVAVDPVAGTVSIAPEDGGSTVILKVDGATLITRNGEPALIGDLLFGDKVEAHYDSATMLATTIDAEENNEQSEVEGVITAIDLGAGTITINGEGEGAESDSSVPMEVTLNVDSSTVIMRDESPVPFSSLQVGQSAEAQYDPLTMLASFVEAEDSGD